MFKTKFTVNTTNPLSNLLLWEWVKVGRLFRPQQLPSLLDLGIHHFFFLFLKGDLGISLGKEWLKVISFRIFLKILYNEVAIFVFISNLYKVQRLVLDLCFGFVKWQRKHLFNDQVANEKTI